MTRIFPETRYGWVTFVCSPSPFILREQFPAILWLHTRLGATGPTLLSDHEFGKPSPLLSFSKDAFFSRFAARALPTNTVRASSSAAKTPRRVYDPCFVILISFLLFYGPCVMAPRPI